MGECYCNLLLQIGCAPLHNLLLSHLRSECPNNSYPVSQEKCAMSPKKYELTFTEPLPGCCNEWHTAAENAKGY